MEATKELDGDFNLLSRKKHNSCGRPYRDVRVTYVVLNLAGQVHYVRLHRKWCTYKSGHILWFWGRFGLRWTPNKACRAHGSQHQCACLSEEERSPMERLHLMRQYIICITRCKSRIFMLPSLRAVSCFFVSGAHSPNVPPTLRAHWAKSPPGKLLSSYFWHILSFPETFKLVPGGRFFADQQLNLFVVCMASALSRRLPPSKFNY